MRALALCIVMVVVLAPSAQALTEVRDPGKVNKILMYGTFATPDLQPGDSGTIAFDFHNPYNADMTNVVLNVSMYRYIEQDLSMNVDSSWRWEFPKFDGAAAPGRDKALALNSVAPDETRRISLTVRTSGDMPHGDVFDQGAYLVRFWLTFTFNGSQARMASPGYWSKEQFMYATEEGDRCPSSSVDCVGQVNLSRLGGIDGILPDTAFGIKDAVPMWPMYLLVAGIAFFTVLAFLYYAGENPSKYPRSARAFAEFRGKLARVFRPRGKTKTPKG